MSERSLTDFTGNAREIKDSLDSFFQIPLKEEAFAIIEKMKKLNTDLNKTALGDRDVELLEILGNDDEYIEEHSAIQFDGTTKAVSLFVDRFGDKYNFDDVKRNAEVIKEYESYVKKLKSIKELDVLFLDKLNAVYSKYKSSSDYMERLVRRLLKHNFNYTDADLKEDTTRVLILKRFLNAFGYDCIEEISTPELEDIVKSNFDCDISKITDSIFEYIDEEKDGDTNSYSEEYVDALVKLQGSIIHKSSTICVDKELCKKICEIISEKKFEEKNGKTEEIRILSDEAINGDARFLKDCFYESEAFSIDCFKNYKNIELNKLLELNSIFKSLHTKGKKNGEIAINAIDPVVRISVLVADFSDKILITEANIELVMKAFSKINCKIGSTLDECLTLKERNTIKGLKRRDIVKDLVRYEAIKEFLENAENEMLSGDTVKYLELIYKKISDRYNGATSPSKKDSLFKKANEILGVKRSEYKLLKIADDLANAKFSTQGKSREYLYHFAIAFDMTASGYNENSFMANDEKNADPRKITDIQKNLFYDYYADNIINNLPRVSGIGTDAKGTDIRIDGYGINYKNFAEIAFLWCLNQKDKTAKEKLKMAYEIISYCKKNGKTAEEIEKFQAANDEMLTKHYRNRYVTTPLKTIDDIERYLIEYYACKSNSGVMQINNDAKTAQIVVSKQETIVNALLKSVENQLLYDETEEDIRSRLEDGEIADFFNECVYLTSNRCIKCIKNSEIAFPGCSKYFDEFEWEDGNGDRRSISTCYDFYYDFKETWTDRGNSCLKKNIKEVLEHFDPAKMYFERSFSNTKELCYENQKELRILLERIGNRLKIEQGKGIHFSKASRSVIIALCFYEMVLINWRRRLSDDVNMFRNFGEFFESFCNGSSFVITTNNKRKKLDYYGANRWLELAGYQKINCKNIYDIYLIFIAYKDNYLPIYSSQSDSIIDYYAQAYQKYTELAKEKNNRIKNENNISKNR